MSTEPGPNQGPPEQPEQPQPPQYVSPPGQVWQPQPPPAETPTNWAAGQPPAPYGQQYAAGPPAQQAYPYTQPYAPGQVSIRRKDRSVALILAIFLSFFTWLYTIERDGWKFWVNLVVLIVNMVLSGLTLGIWLFIAIPVGLGVWIWAIVDVAVKPRTFYDNYPAG